MGVTRRECHKKLGNKYSLGKGERFGGGLKYVCYIENVKIRR
jgi:hypothetical protein